MYTSYRSRNQYILELCLVPVGKLFGSMQLFFSLASKFQSLTFKDKIFLQYYITLQQSKRDSLILRIFIKNTYSIMPRRH